MRKIIVISMISLDGVMQAPGGPQEDPSNGFKYGGWVGPYSDDVDSQIVKRQLQDPVEYILGRKTFEIWENYWPQRGHIWPGINKGTKYVMSTTRKETDWENTVFLDSLEDLKKVKGSPGPDIHVWGSSEVIHLMLKNDLVDELCLKIYPLTLGKGKKLFDGGSIPAAFKLTESVVTTTGVIIATYKRDGQVKTRNIAV